MPDAAQGWLEVPFVAAGSFRACTLCGSWVDGRLLDVHQQWHANEVHRVADAQRRLTLRNHFPMRPL